MHAVKRLSLLWVSTTWREVVLVHSYGPQAVSGKVAMGLSHASTLLSVHDGRGDELEDSLCSAWLDIYIQVNLCSSIFPNTQSFAIPLTETYCRTALNSIGGLDLSRGPVTPVSAISSDRNGRA